MSLSLNNSRSVRWLIRLTKFAAVLALTVILLASLGLVFLPAAVSTDWSHRFIQKKISNALDRPVKIQRLKWSWSDGLIINQLIVPDLPEFSKNSLAALDHVKLKIDVKKLWRREIRLEFLLAGLNANIIKTNSGTLNVNALGRKDLKKEKHPAPPKKEKDQKKSGKKSDKPFVLPSMLKDVSVDIRLTGINLCYDDQVKEQIYRIQNFEFHVRAPSIKSAPVCLTLNTGIMVNENVIPRSAVTATLNHLFDEAGAFIVSGITAELDATLPGIVAGLEADMAASRIKSKVHIDLASLADAAAPLIPNFPSPTDLKGKIVLTAATSTNPDDPIAFDAGFSGSDLFVSGKLIDGKSLGPGNVSLHLNGIVDLKKELLDLNAADLLILENSIIQVTGRVEQMKQDNKIIHLTISPLYLDVNEIASFAKPFIPSSLNVDSPAGSDSFISLNRLQIDGNLLKRQTDVSLDGLKIHLPKIALTDKTDGQAMLRVFGSRINLEKLTAHLNDLFPDSAALTLSVAMDKLFSGKDKSAVSISGIRLDRLHADAAKIAKTNDSQVPVSGDFSLDNRLNVDRIAFANLAQVNDLSQSIKIKAHIDPNKKITGSLDHLDVNSQKVRILKEGIAPIDTGMDIHLALDKFFVKDLDPLNLDIKNFIAHLLAEDALSIALTASAVDTAKTSFKADIRMDADLNTLVKKIPPKLLAGISGAGDLSIALNAEGRRPVAKETDALKKMEFAKNLSFIDYFRLDAGLDNGALKISRPDNQAIKIDSLTGRPLLKYELKGDTGKGKLDSDIRAGAVTGLPGIGSDAPISGRLSISADHEYTAMLDLNQSFSIAPAGIEETIHVTLDGLDRIITQDPMPKLPLWISKAGADISARIVIPDCRMLSDFGIAGLSETGIDGMAAAGVKFQVMPGKSVVGSISLTGSDMNFALPKKVSVENINADFDFSKSYDIVFAKQPAPISENPGLSFTVFESGAPSFPADQNTDIYRHIRQRYERMNPNPALSFSKADVMVGPFPLVIGESMVMLNLNNGLPNLDYFQFDLLGGTINGSVSFSNTQKKLNVNTALTFSGINTAQIFPRSFSKEDDSSKADISGALYADFPLTDQLQPMLENTAVTLEFTRIGSRALERLLYALDPYENNEAIVNQRRFLKNGSPKNIRMEIKNGFLTLTGKVTIKGFDISLPSIRRLNIAQIPGLEKFEKKLSGLTPVIRILQTVSAKKIVVNKETDTVHFE